MSVLCFLSYRYFVAHAFEPLYEFGCGTCLLRQLLQIVREFRLQREAKRKIKHEIQIKP